MSVYFHPGSIEYAVSDMVVEYNVEKAKHYVVDSIDHFETSHGIRLGSTEEFVKYQLGGPALIEQQDDLVMYNYTLQGDSE